MANKKIAFSTFVKRTPLNIAFHTRAPIYEGGKCVCLPRALAHLILRACAKKRKKSLHISGSVLPQQCQKQILYPPTHYGLPEISLAYSGDSGAEQPSPIFSLSPLSSSGVLGVNNSPISFLWGRGGDTVLGGREASAVSARKF